MRTGVTIAGGRRTIRQHPMPRGPNAVRGATNGARDQEPVQNTRNPRILNRRGRVRNPAKSRAALVVSRQGRDSSVTFVPTPEQ